MLVRRPEHPPDRGTSRTGSPTATAGRPQETAGTAIARSGGVRAGGFTLLEMLLVITIIGVLVTATALTLHGRGFDPELDRQGRRLAALLELAAEEALLQGRELGVELFDDRYRFLVHDHDRGWTSLENDRHFRSRRIPDGIRAELYLEGRGVVLSRAVRNEARPQIVLYSSGEMTPFRLDLQRADRARLRLVADAAGELQLEREERLRR